MRDNVTSSGDGHTPSSTSEKPSNAPPHDNPLFINAEARPSTWRSELAPFLGHWTKPKDLKVLLRCSLAVWVATLFLLVDPLLQNYGTAAFFGPILLLIVPPSGILLINIVGGITAIIGMCLGWAWGVITWKASLATRSTAETNALLARLGQQVAGQAMNSEKVSGQSNYAQILIFEGFALDTRIVVTQTIMLVIFIYFIARLGIKVPKLKLVQVFAMVVADIFLTIAPLIPTFTGTIPQVLVKPAATAVAINCACSLLIFPESTSSASLSGFETVLSMMKSLVDACRISFEHHPVEFDLEKLESTRGAILGAYQGLEANLGFLPLDFSLCSLNTEDITSLKEPLERLMVAFLGLLQLQASRTLGSQRAKKFEHVREVLEQKAEYDPAIIPKHGHSQIMKSFELSQRFLRDQESILWGKSVRSLGDASRGILSSSLQSIDAIIEAMHNTNTRRWTKRPSMQERKDLCDKHRDILSQLARNKTTFANQNKEQLLGHHLHLFNEEGLLRIVNDGESHPVRGLLLALVFEERILQFAGAVHGMLDRIVQIEQERTKIQLWAPRSLSHAANWTLGDHSTPTHASSKLEREPSAKSQGIGSRKTPPKQEKQKDAEDNSAKRQLQDLRVSAGRQRSGLSKFLVAALGWLSSEEGVYALRVVVVTIALTLPAIIKHSAGFYYRERGLWALIMSQTGMVLFTADFFYGLVARLLGTVLGGLVGTLCWYIGAGNGPGNPYGMAAIVALAIVIIMYCRLFAPPNLLQVVMLFGSTFYLVIGYSWDDTHIPSYGNPGVGYSVFWRRTLLVVIGFSAAAIVTLFPKPPSATRNVAETLARCLRTNKDVYALLLNTWDAPAADIESVIRETSISNGQSLGPLPAHISMLKYEFSTRNLDPKALAQVTKQCESISSNLTQLSLYAAELKSDLKLRFAHVTGATSPGLAADVMAVLSLLEQSLKTGDPLPALMPTPLIGRSFSIGSTAHAEHALSLATMRDENFIKYCAALNAWLGLLNAIDDTVLILKEALGEEHVVTAWDSDLFRTQA